MTMTEWTISLIAIAIIVAIALSWGRAHDTDEHRP
jgi:DNA-binding transcriptional regulator of glucitol operon